MGEWDLETHQVESIRFALGGSVTSMHLQLLTVFSNVYSSVFEREAHTFYSRA